jgi:hypothetical protein
MQGHRPLVFFTRVGKPSIRMAVSGAGAEKKSADRCACLRPGERVQGECVCVGGGVELVMCSSCQRAQHMHGSGSDQR